MKLPFAIWYLRNGHLVSHPATEKGDKNGNLYVYFFSEDTCQLLYFITTHKDLVQKIQDYGENRYKNYIIKRNLAYVANSFPLALYGWSIPMQYSQFSEYEKIQRTIANSEIRNRKEFQRGNRRRSFYLDELISLSMISKNPISVQRAYINDFAPEEFIQIYYRNSRHYEGIQVSLRKNGNSSQDTKHSVDIRDILFQWKLRSPTKEGRKL